VPSVASQTVTVRRENPTPVGAVTFKNALAHVATPVSVVAILDSGGSARGVTVGTLCSLSLRPPLVMFCLDRSGRSHQVLTTASRLLIHMLRDDQAVAARFARTDLDRFERREKAGTACPPSPARPSGCPAPDT
jgi:flavin reductase (DIM6/NTAB) family NADH-FMN oxidoreductase RutF